MGIQWYMCAEYDCTIVPFNPALVTFSLEHSTLLSRNVGANLDLTAELRNCADMMAEWMENNTNLNNPPYNGLDIGTRDFLTARLREVCDDENEDRRRAKAGKLPMRKVHGTGKRTDAGWRYINPTPAAVVPAVVPAVGPAVGPAFGPALGGPGPIAVGGRYF